MDAFGVALGVALGVWGPETCRPVGLELSRVEIGVVGVVGV